MIKNQNFRQTLNNHKTFGDHGLFYTRYYFDEETNKEKEERTLIKTGGKKILGVDIANKKRELGIGGKTYKRVNNLDVNKYSAIRVENGKTVEKYEVLAIKK